MRRCVKNLSVIKDPQEIEDYIYSLWATDEFKNSHKDPNGYINRIVKMVSSFPRFFADMTDPTLEWSHFYSYFNILIRRTYHNKTIQDLYYLHELVHIGSMLYSDKIDFDTWMDKMTSNEMFASLESEIYVYESLAIRGKGFNFEIWYDSLSKGQLADREYIKSLRKERMINPQTEPEILLNKYHNNNRIWGEIWRKNYQRVESALCQFHFDSITDPDTAISNYRQFIKDNSKDDILFKEEAEKFSKVYLSK